MGFSPPYLKTGIGWHWLLHILEGQSVESANDITIGATDQQSKGTL